MPNNAKGQVSQVEDAAGNRTYYAYDADSGRRIAVTNAVGEATYYHYDAEGHLLGTWGATYPVAYEYDDQGRMTTMYTSAGRLGKRTWARGETTTYAYDGCCGALTNIDYSATDTADISFTYDRMGRQATVTDAQGTRTFAYDADNTPARLGDRRDGRRRHQRDRPVL